MIAQISVTEARSRLSAIVARAEAGERIVLTRHGHAIACITPVPRTVPVKFGDLRGTYTAKDLSLPWRLKSPPRAARRLAPRLRLTPRPGPSRGSARTSPR